MKPEPCGPCGERLDDHDLEGYCPRSPRDRAVNGDTMYCPLTAWNALQDSDRHVLHLMTERDDALAQVERLREALEQLHGAVDDFNASSEKDDDPNHTLCWLCGAFSYGAEEGIAHHSDCVMLLARAALASLPQKEAQPR